MQPCVHRAKQNIFAAAVILLGLTHCRAAAQQAHEDTLAIAPMQSKSLLVPRLASAPTMADFEGLEARGIALQMVVVSNFIQSDPSDGQKATQRTQVYL